MLMPSAKNKESLIGQLLTHVRIPLFRHGYLLTLSSMITSGFGLLYWAAATRLYSAEVVGLSAATISAMMLLAGIAVLSLSGVLVRFVPSAGGATRRLIISTYLISALAAVIVGATFIWGVGIWAPKLLFLFENRMLGGIFVFATIVWCVFSLQDSTLTGLRQTMWIPIENISFAVVKLILLVSFVRLFPDWGIFAAWTIPVIVSLLPVNFLLFRYLIPKHILATADYQAHYSLRDVIQYIIGNYPGTLFYLASTTLLPLIVTQQVGTRANAYFYIPWIIANALFQVTLNMTMSLTVEAMTDQAKIGIFCYRVLLQAARLLVPVVLMLIIGASFFLRLFGDAYADEGATLLRLLAIASLPNIPIMLYIGLARIKNLVGSIIFVQGIQAFLLLGLSYILLPIYGITGVGMATLISQLFVAFLTMLTQLRPVLQNGRDAYNAEA